MSVDCFCIEAIDDFTNSVCSLTHSTGDSACASWRAWSQNAVLSDPLRT
jgi:hypothetical protein